jgi:hypothetical protein
MQVARDSRSGKLVRAADGSLDKHRYLCPTCSKRVYKRPSKVNSPCFAHFPGEGSVDCNFYHPSAEDASELPRELRAQNPATLRLFLQLTGRPTEATHWQLELVVPRCRLGEGSVHVDYALRGSITLPCSGLRVSGKRVAVPPQTQAYRLRLSGPIDEGYLRAASAEAPGLSPTAPNLFALSDDGGQRLGDGRPIHWAGLYALIHATESEPTWSTTVWHRSLSRRGDWSCAVFRIPVEADNETRRWIEDALGREVVAPQVGISIVAPVPIGTDEDGTIVVSDGSRVVIAVTGQRGSQPPPGIRLRKDGGSMDVVSLPRSLPAFVFIGGVDRDGTELTLEDDRDDSSLRIRASDLTLNRVLPDARLQLRDTITGGSFETAFYSEHAAAGLQGIRDRRLALDGVVIPRRLKVKIQTRPDRAVGTLVKVLESRRSESDHPPEAHEEFQQRVCLELSTLLQRDGGFLRVDLGCLGRPAIDGSRPTRSHIPVAGLSGSSRNMIRWVIGVTEGADMEARSDSTALLPVTRVLGGKRIHPLHPEDAGLLSRLVSLGLYPPVLESHLQEISRRVVAVYSRGTR